MYFDIRVRLKAIIIILIFDSINIIGANVSFTYGPKCQCQYNVAVDNLSNVFTVCKGHMSSLFPELAAS